MRASAGVSVHDGCAGDFGIANRLFAARHAAADGDRGRLTVRRADTAWPASTARSRRPRPEAPAIRARSTAGIARCRAAPNGAGHDRSPPPCSAGECACSRMTSPTPSSAAITAMPSRSRRRAPRLRIGRVDQRSQRQPDDHAIQPPLFIARRRDARAASAGLWVTTRIAVPSALTRSNSVRDVLAGLFVELAGRFVGEQQRRPVGQRARDRDALHLAAGELRGQVIARDRQARRNRAARASARGARRPRRRLPPAAARRSPRRSSIGSRKKRWKTNPMRVRRMRPRSASESCATSRPSNSSDPLVGVSTQPSRCSSVDLPQPDGPVIATYSPASTVSRHVAQRHDRTGGHRKHAADIRAPSTIGISHEHLAAQRGRNRQTGGQPDRIDAAASAVAINSARWSTARAARRRRSAAARGGPASGGGCGRGRARAAPPSGSASSPPPPTSSADSHSSIDAMRGRPMPSARSAAISPSRWLIDTVSSVATSRNANTIVSDDSTSEI